ncbi:hypothetical protein M3Y98_00712600 [Aphelenchoides besseyi]|nr:hypothetical protein M3Y98_00712600 [Aphelenchoides besseyi]KAI6210315.1 hypothetical protein M3Y96_00315000 [Aphelenchoides besseyi]
MLTRKWSKQCSATCTADKSTTLIKSLIVYFLFDQYHLEGLTGMCMKALGENLSLENIIQRLQHLVYPEPLNAFKKPVFKFVEQNFASICAFSKWQLLSSSM